MQVATQACLEQDISLLHLFEKVGKEEVQGSGSAQACSQGMEEQVAVKHLNLILCDLMKGSPAVLKIGMGDKGSPHLQPEKI